MEERARSPYTETRLEKLRRHVPICMLSLILGLQVTFGITALAIYYSRSVQDGLRLIPLAAETLDKVSNLTTDFDSLERYLIFYAARLEHMFSFTTGAEACLRALGNCSNTL